MKLLLLFIWCIILNLTVLAKEYHVAKTGMDSNPGTAELPLLTIQAAANLAQPGDIVTVHKGIYCERVSPPRGGNSESERIIYKAAEGEIVEIKGSEIINGWEKFKGDVWKVSLPNSFFNNYNPYKDLIHGDWFNSLKRTHHTGEIYLNGKSLWEMALLEKVLNPKQVKDNFDPEGSVYTWFCESDDSLTYLYANFHSFDPNKETVEINVRETCFYPDSTGINFITVKGFKMSQAATQWAPPTAEQIGIIGTNWSKGWIIENNIISDSKCSGITLGKHGDEYDNTSEDSAEGYVETIHRAIKRGWDKKNIGSHIVRNNTISNCEQTGICGSLGAIFSTIENNLIYNIWTKRQFTGAEMAGIKIHASIDMVIRKNRLINCGRGLWLDWMAQGTRVTQNLFYRNSTDDIFVEVNHGPFLIDNNVLLSPVSLRDWSEGGAYVHNLFAGNIEIKPQGRFTPFHKPHSTELAGLKQTHCGDNRFYNNLFVKGVQAENFKFKGLAMYDSSMLPCFANGNVYSNGIKGYLHEQNSYEANLNLNIKLSEDQKSLILIFDNAINKYKTKLVNTQILAKAFVSEQAYENPDESPLLIDYDYFGIRRKKENPMPGPFENFNTGKIELKVWN